MNLFLITKKIKKSLKMKNTNKFFLKSKQNALLAKLQTLYNVAKFHLTSKKSISNTFLTNYSSVNAKT